jgi:hypothetical protein
VNSLTDKHEFVDGQLVSQKAQRVVQALKDYEPELEVRWIPPGARKEGDAAYAIIHDAPGNGAYVLFYVQNDEDFDERVVQRVIFNDQRNGKASLSELESWEAAQKLVEKQAHLDAMEEAMDIAKFVAKTHLNKIRIDKNTTIYDHGNNLSKVR